MESNPESPDPQTIPYLYRYLRDRMKLYGFATTIEECQAVCKLLARNSVGYTPAILAALEQKELVEDGYQNRPSLLTLLLMIARQRVVTLRKISLPLDPRKGGEIRLPAELAQLTKPQALLEVADKLLRDKFFEGYRVA